MDCQDLVNALYNPNAYPHAVEKVQVQETYISWIILTGLYAYKIKKPVNFVYLDFSSLKLRQHFCEEELRLNKRFAPHLYLEVVAITENAGKVEVNGNGAIVEYAVKMRQFDPSHTLDKLADKGLLDDKWVGEIGRTLASFHKQLESETKPTVKTKPQPGTPAAVWNPIEQNFQQIAPLLDNQKDSKKLARLKHWSELQFKQLSPVIEQRSQNGFVRECHGDLHLGNMVLTHSGDSSIKKVMFFDCIEFNPSFRQIDIACELAFTVMDLDARSMSGSANIMLNTYLEYTGDYSGLKLLNFYKVYFAVVRAKVALLQIANDAESDITAHRNYSTFLKYIDLALSYTIAQSPFVAITYGLSGSGKSTVAQAIAAASGAIRLRSDVERKRLFGLAPTQASDGDIYTPDASEKTFAQLHRLVNEVTVAGFACIIDATFLHVDLREQFHQQAKQLELPFYILDCHAPQSVLIQRVNQREKSADDASEATLTVMLNQQKHRQALTADELRYQISIDTTVELPLPAIVTRLKQAK
jgi:uncharacterized protein